MILVKSYVHDHVGRKLAELRVVKSAEQGTDCWSLNVILTENHPDGPDVVWFRFWDAATARLYHDGIATAERCRNGTGREGTVRTETPGLHHDFACDLCGIPLERNAAVYPRSEGGAFCSPECRDAGVNNGDECFGQEMSGSAAGGTDK